MGDPKRWLEGGGTAREKRLMALLRDADGPKGEREAIWAAMAASVAAPALGSAATSAGSAAVAKSAGLAGVLKVTAAGVALAGASWVVTDALLPAQPVTAPIASVAPAPRPSPPIPSRPLAPVPPAQIATAPPPVAIVSPPPQPPRVTTPAPTTPAPQSSLREESRLLEGARDALRRGDVQGALAALDAEGKRFPNGVLDQERRTLLVGALAASGDKARAAEEARAFERIYPSSPLLPRVRAEVE
jgi:hypothetical protein